MISVWWIIPLLMIGVTVGAMFFGLMEIAKEEDDREEKRRRRNHDPGGGTDRGL